MRERIRIAVSAPQPLTAADMEWGLIVTPWLPPEAMQGDWESGPAIEADRILVPFTFGTVSASPFACREGMRRFLRMLPHFRDAPERHLLLDNTDLDGPVADVEGAALFKTSISDRYPDVHSLPYLLPDPGVPHPVAGAELDLAFQGSLETHPIRNWMDRWRHSWKGLRVECRATPRPFWMLEHEAQVHWGSSYVEQFRRTRFVLCPRGRGLNSRRFFETLAHGRVPILITDVAKLPLESRIDYSRFVIRVPEGFGRWTPEYVADFLGRNDLGEACDLARRTWLEWFTPGRFHDFLQASLPDKGTCRTVPTVVTRGGV